MEERKYPILKTPNFYFPILYKGKKFKVLTNYTIDFKDKPLLAEFNMLKKNKLSNYLRIYANICWKAVKKEKLDKKYSNYWIVPIRISNEGDLFIVDLDILKPCK